MPTFAAELGMQAASQAASGLIGTGMGLLRLQLLLLLLPFHKLNQGVIKYNKSYVGERLEEKIQRITSNKEPIKDGAHRAPPAFALPSLRYATLLPRSARSGAGGPE